jgi:hypothetical protein
VAETGGYTWADLKYQGGGRTARTHVIRGEWRAHPQYVAFEKKALCGLSLSSGECWVTWGHKPVSFPCCGRCERILEKKG